MLSPRQMGESTWAMNDHVMHPPIAMDNNYVHRLFTQTSALLAHCSCGIIGCIVPKVACPRLANHQDDLTSAIDTHVR
jgi:hypothetical protein